MKTPGASQFKNTQPYRIGMVQYLPKPFQNITADSYDSEDIEDDDPGREVIEKNARSRFQRIADDTKDELQKVLKRVDNTLTNYEYSVQSSLVQHGMNRSDMTSVEHVQDIRELEELLNDSLAKQRFFYEQKQSFNSVEFKNYDDQGEALDDIEPVTFDVKDCFIHVKTLGTRLNELNEEIIQFLIQNVGTKQTNNQVLYRFCRGKRKLEKMSKEAKEQLQDLQNKLESANSEMTAKETKIQQLLETIETVKTESKTKMDNQRQIQKDEVQRKEVEIAYYKKRVKEFEDQIKKQMGTDESQSDGERHELEENSLTKINLETIGESDNKHDDETESTRIMDIKEKGSDRGSTNSPTAQTNANRVPEQIKIVTASQVPAAAPPAVVVPEPIKKEKSKRTPYRSKKEDRTNQGAEDPSEVYRRGQEILESLLADKEGAPDLNKLLNVKHGTDLNHVSIDSLPTAFTNLRKYAIARVTELIKELETKENSNKETVQILKQEFVEHKVQYDKERLLFFLSLNPDDNWQEEQNELMEKADIAHKLQIKAQKTAEDALRQMEGFMVEQEKLDQQDVARQIDIIRRHSIALNSVSKSPEHATDIVEEIGNDRLSPHPKRSKTPQWPKLSVSGGQQQELQTQGQDSKRSVFETAQLLTRLNSTHNSPPKQLGNDSTPPSPVITKSFFRKKSSDQQDQGSQQLTVNSSTVASRRISMALNDENIPSSKTITPQGAHERTPPSRNISRSNSFNPNNRTSSSSGDRSYFASASQSRRPSISFHKSPVRAEELERLLTKVVNDEIEALEEFRQTSVKSRTSLREKYMSLLEEKKAELDDLKQQADNTLSRPATTSTRERKPLESLENSLGNETLKHEQKQQSSPLEQSIGKENEIVKSEEQQQSEPQPLETVIGKENVQVKNEQPPPILKREQQQQTSRPSTAKSQKDLPVRVDMVKIDTFKYPFFQVYENIYKFRTSVTKLLEENKFSSLSDRLSFVKKLSFDDSNGSNMNDITDNADQVLKDTVKVIQLCLNTLKQSSTPSTPSRKENETDKLFISANSQQQQSSSSSMEKQDSEKDKIIQELKAKYDAINDSLYETDKKHEDELKQNERVMLDLQKMVQTLQKEVARLQRRISRTDVEGLVEPSVLFTRLDAERNNHTLKNAVNKGKVPEIIYNELNDSMSDYVSLPTQQFGNLVKKYIQQRKVSELENRIRNEPLDNETKNVIERMESFHERRSGQISEKISNIRQHRVDLAKKMTEKFDHLEKENTIFLIRPIYSYQGRAAAQTFMKREKHHREMISKKSNKMNDRLDPSELTETIQSDEESHRKTTTRVQTFNSSEDDDERLWHMDKSFGQTPASQTSTDQDKTYSNLTEIPKLVELDVNKMMMPHSLVSTSLNQPATADLTVPSLNLRSYMNLSRPVNGRINTNQEPRESAASVASALSRTTNPRTPFNSTVGTTNMIDIRRSSPPLPPIGGIKAYTNSSASTNKLEENQDEFLPSVSNVTDDYKLNK
ncbi:unnamed protein product [Didymodactylos carnosus]|uniref:Uncharacterized protein n=1 Tax=Didymodactylos carnosus TaxID=1234261 RepID=A0A813UV06_9BILA|nr:unnamed protein product [Didymodactylos carnosus]CAF3619801.1 unnamed protein product [Didymodactylos carnosus]